MRAAELGPSEDHTRIWGIVLTGLLSATLAFVLIRTRTVESPAAHESSSQESAQGAAAQPSPLLPEAPPPNPKSYYRGWPLFEGWPLTQVPSKTWGTDSQAGQGPGASPEPSRQGAGLDSQPER